MSLMVHMERKALFVCHMYFIINFMSHLLIIAIIIIIIFDKQFLSLMLFVILLYPVKYNCISSISYLVLNKLFYVCHGK